VARGGGRLLVLENVRVITIARASAVAVLVLIFAVTPLSALIGPPNFEVWFAAQDLTVTLNDRTGLVRGMVASAPRPGVQPSVDNDGSDAKKLLVTLDGSSCDSRVTLTLTRAAPAFLLTESTQRRACALGTGSEHLVAILLWSPIAAHDVRFGADAL